MSAAFVVTESTAHRRDAEIEQFLRRREPEEQTVTALWWAGAAT